MYYVLHVHIYIYIQNSNNTKNNSSYVYTVLGGLCFRSHFCLLLKPQVFLVKSRKKGFDGCIFDFPPSEMAFSWCSTAHKCWWWRLPYTFLVVSLISGLRGFGIPNVAADQCAFVVSAPCAGKSQSTSCTTKKGDPRAVALLGRKFHGSFSGQAFHGELEASLGGEPLGTSAVERGSEADGATKDKKLNSYALPFFGRVGAWLV